MFPRSTVRFFALLICLAGLGAVASAANNPLPLIYPLNPAATAPGGPSFTLTVNGPGFVSGAVVNWNGSARTTTFVSSSQVAASITAADIATAGTAVITVTNPAPGGGTSNKEYFQVIQAPTPTNFYNGFNNIVVDAPRTGRSNVLAADFNGDGKPDLAEYINGIIYVVLGDGHGGFGNSIGSAGPPPPPSSCSSTDPNTYVSAADMNGDGKLDLVIMNCSGTTVALGNGDGTFRLLSPLALVVPFGKPVIADFNGDGALDLAYIQLGAGSTPQGIVVLLGNGDGTFKATFLTGPALTSNFQVRAALATGDFNADGKLDLLVSVIDSSGCIAGNFSLFDFPGNGDGSFGTPSQVPGTTTCGNSGLTNALVADFNGDGKQDIAYFNVESGIFGPNPGFLSVSLGNGDGTFGSPNLVLANVNQNTGPTVIGPVLEGDFNGDGKPDLVAGNQLFYGNGDGTFSPLAPPQTGFQVVQVGDFNGDGALDLLALGGPFGSTSTDLRLLLQTATPDFTGKFTSSQTQAVTQGSSVTFAGQVVAINGFTGDVVLSASGLPSGVTPTFNPPTVTGGSGNWTLTLAASSSTAPGTYTITVTGTSGSLTHSATITLVVNAFVPDFSGASNPSYQTVVAGGSATYTITVTAIDGFTGTVQFSATGLPAGATAQFNPPTISGSGTTTLTITTAANTPTATYPIQLTGTSGTLSHRGNVNLNVGSAGTDFTDFGGSVSPGSVTTQAGASASFNITAFPINGFNSALSLSVSGLPAGASATFTPNSIPGGSGSSVLQVTVPNSTPTATYQLIVTATGGGHTHTNGVFLNVGPAGTDFTDFTGSVTPSSQTVAAGGTTTFTATVQPFNGTGCVYLSVSGLPSPYHAYFDRSTPICGTAASTVFTIVTYPQTPLGTYTLTFTGVVQGTQTVHSRTVTLTVTP